MTRHDLQFLITAAGASVLTLGLVAGCVTADEQPGVPAPSATPAPAPATTPKPKPKPRATPTPTPDPADTVKVPASIDATGASNVSDAMDSFVSDVPDGSTIVFPRGATYLLDDDGFVLVGRKDLTFDGRDTKLKFTGCGTSDSAFKLTRTSGITIQDFVLIGDNPGSYSEGCESSEGVAMYGALDTTISRVDVRRPYGHCWYADDKDSRWTDGVLIEDSSCVRAGVMGLAIVAGRNITIEGSTMKDIALFPFDIEPSESDGGGEFIIIRDNVVDGYGISEDYTPWVLAAATNVGSVRDIRFVRNHVVRGATHGHTLAGLATRMDGTTPKRNIVIRDNTTDVPGEGPVMRFQNVDGLTVNGNDQPLESGNLTSCTGCTNVESQ